VAEQNEEKRKVAKAVTRERERQLKKAEKRAAELEMLESDQAPASLQYHLEVNKKMGVEVPMQRVNSA
jgi:hypothetical protein